jgi:hypothetical protein
MAQEYQPSQVATSHPHRASHGEPALTQGAEVMDKIFA